MGLDRDLLFVVTALSRGLLVAEEILSLGPELQTGSESSVADLLVQRGRLSSSDRAWLDAQVDARLLSGSGSPRTAPDELTIDFPGTSLVLGSLDGGPVTSHDDPTGQWGGSSTEPDLHTVSIEAAFASLADPPPSSERYRWGRCLARGGMGEVWVVRDEHLGRDVILKVVRSDRRGSHLSERFLREARVSGRLEHPSIVTVHEVAGAEGGPGTPFFTMRQVRGRTLSQAIRDYHASRSGGSTSRVELVGLLQAFMTACRAVAYAHRYGIVHRDLKPANIALGDFGEVIVLDWGLAKVRGTKNPDPAPVDFQDLKATPEATLDGAVLGTLPYMPPEQAQGLHDQIDERSDVYSLGAILYEILTGRRPFSGHGSSDYVRQILGQAPVPPRQHDPSIAPALAAVCLKAMAKAPDQRYATATDLADDVRRWLADEPVSAHDEPWPTRLGRQARRHRTLVAAAGVLLASAVVALGVGYVLVRNERDQVLEERRQAVEARHQAEAQRFRAEAIRDVARNVSIDLLVAVADVELDGLPGVMRVRRHVAEEAAKAYQIALRRKLDDDLLDLDAAQVFRHVGNIHRMTDELDPAIEWLERATALLDALVRAHPETPQYRDRLAETLRDLAAAESRVGRTGDVELALRRSLELAEGLRRQHPNSAAYARTEALDLLDLGSIEVGDGRFAAARDHLDGAISTLVALADQNGKDTMPTDSVLAVLAQTYQAEVHRRDGRLEEASQTVHEAIRRGRLNVENLASFPDSRATLASALFERARLLIAKPGQEDLARHDLDEAAAILEAVAREHREITYYSSRLSEIQIERGWLLVGSGDIEAARDDAKDSLERLLTLDQAPQVSIYHAPIASALGLLGHLDLESGDLESAHALLAEAEDRADRAAVVVPGDILGEDALRHIRTDVQNLTGQTR